MKHKIDQKYQSGAALVEYVIAVGLLIAVFVAAGSYLIIATNRRADLSIQGVSRDIPCVNPTLFPMQPAELERSLTWNSAECD